MSVKPILLLGDDRLYDNSKTVNKEELDYIKTVVNDLHDTLIDFRNKYKAGRAIAAPQINVFKRLIYMYIDIPIVFINPILEFRSTEKFELWDDCMSFPKLKVKVKRYKDCTIHYKNLDWEDCSMVLDGDLSELIQHEYDHLDGILATQRAIDNKSLKIDL